MIASFYRIINEDRDRIARPSLTSWINKLDRLFEENIVCIKSNNKFKKLEILVNQLSLILFYIGEVDLSCKLCFNAQNFFFQVYIKKQIYNCPNKFGIIQPWINLIRISRITQNYTKAQYQIDQIYPKDRYQLGDNILYQSQLGDAAKQLIYNCFVNENIKLLISEKRLELLTEFISEIVRKHYIPLGQMYLLLEARIIELFHSGAANIPDYISTIIDEISTEEHKFFELKLVQYYIAKSEKDIAFKKLKKLEIIFDQSNSNSLYILRFWLKIGQSYCDIQAYQEAYNLFNKLYKLFIKHNDYLSLYEMSYLMKETNYYDQIWQNIYQNSSYRYCFDNKSRIHSYYKNCINLNDKVNSYIFSFFDQNSNKIYV